MKLGNSMAPIDAEILYRTILGREIDRDAWVALSAGRASPMELARELIQSDEFLYKWVLRNHLMLIHEARLQGVRALIPPGRRILDLGGANAPLHRMGYPHAFDSMVMVDLPPEDRHEMYAHIVIDDKSASGELLIHFGDMTKLDAFEAESFDLVWSGQSIEHIPEEAGKRMCRESFRVLKRGGIFCPDTPNGEITSLHAATGNLKFIHPEHFIEYRPAQLQAILKDAGFRIQSAYGIREMPTTAQTRVMDYRDFVRGRAICLNVASSYIQFYACQKP